MNRIYTLCFALVLLATPVVAQPRSGAAIAADLEKLAAEVRLFDPPTTQPITQVKAGDNLQTAINNAQPGAILVLEAGARFTGTFVFPLKPAGAPITLRSSATVPERRVTPADAALMPTIVPASADGAFRFENTARWRLEGLRFESVVGGHNEILIIQGSDDIVLDRILMVAGPDGQKRGIRGNGTKITLTRSHIANMIRAGQDSQAFCAWEGAGPYVITDNYLEGSGENILFGGADNYKANGADNPSDILIEGNHIFKPLAWKTQPGTVKNLLELKNATRVIIRNNLLENNWTDAQAGFSVLFTPMNQDGRAPWTVVKDVLFERNVLRGVERGINVIGRDYGPPTGYGSSQQSSGIVIRKNLVEVSGQFLQIAGEIADLTVEDNVAINGYNIATVYFGDVRETTGGVQRAALFAVSKLVFNRNFARHNDYGIIGEGYIGTAALVRYTRSHVFTGNKFVGLKGTYPTGTLNIDEATLQAAKASLLTELGR